MLLPDQPLIYSAITPHNKILPDEFGIFCWNIHKENKTRDFEDVIREFKEKFDPDLLLFQEARFSETLFSIAGLPYMAAANIKFLKHYVGVMTASSTEVVSGFCQMTRARETLFATHKNTLVTQYSLENGTFLMVANIHAINLTSSAWYKSELSRIFQLLKDHKGPMIVAGDFNCWNRTRIKTLRQFAERLGLKSTKPLKSKHIMKSFGFELDRIFYRQLKLCEIRAEDTRVSDHNPIIASFQC